MAAVSTRGSIFTLLGVFLAAGSVWGAPATRRVCFEEGRCIDAASVSIEAGRAIVTLPGGGSIAFPESRISRIEAVKAPPAPKPDAPAVEPTAAGQDASADPAPQPVSIESLILDAARKYGLEPDLLAAVIAVESGYRTDAVSPKGAQGLMQLMPATARELDVTDPLDPRQNIDAGARYLRQLLDDNDGHYWRALAAYNAGMGRVARYDGLPPYRETIDYIHRVLNRYKASNLPAVAGDNDR